MGKPESLTDEYDFVDHEDTALSSRILGQIRDWLQPTDYLAESGEYRRHLSAQAPGTGLWICKTDEYQKWHDSADHGCLWIKGVPGAGKSVMAASIIQHLQITENCPVLYFFFRNIVAANFSARALIQDWLAQLLPFAPKLQFALQSRLESKLEETSDNDLIQLFLDGASSLPKVYCVGDALDEMAVSDKPFLDKLNALAAYRSHSLKLLLTSRPKQYLQSALRHSSIVHISLQQQLVNMDIISYLNHRFDQVPGSHNRQHAKEKVIDMVAARSEGLFLYAKLTMDQIEPVLLANNLGDIVALKDSLPAGLEETYSNMLEKQRKEYGVDTDMQVLILEAVTHSSRPLRLNEVASLVKCVFPNILAPAGLKAFIISCCGPLLEVLEDETLQVIHHSFTEFLRGDMRSTNAAISFPILDSNIAHKRMVMHCLQYLQSGSLLSEDERGSNSAPDPSVTFRKPGHSIDADEEHYKREHLGLKEEKDSFNYQQARLDHPFLSYAVENWSYHASHYDVHDQEFFAAVIGFLKHDSVAFQRWLVLQWGSTSREKGTVDGMPTPLHIASFAGLCALALDLLQQGQSVSERDAQERIPLHWAAAKGHDKVVSLLIEHGSDPNAEDGRGLKPIHLAAPRNHYLVVRVLLQAGVEPNTPKTKENRIGRLLGGERVTKGECAILYASQGGHTETVIEMIPFCKAEVLEQLICECCRFSRTEAVLAILERSDVSADATYRGATALNQACASGSPECVKALIDRGANVNIISEYEPRRIINGGHRGKLTAKAPLHNLVGMWRDDNNIARRAIFKILVDAKVDLEQPDGRQDTALMIAAGTKNGYGAGSIHVHAMRALLEAGADVTRLHSCGDTLLHLVLEHHRSPEAVRLLVQYGCDPNQRGSRGETVLQRAMCQTGMVTGVENTETIVRLLLDSGADPNIPDDRGGRAIHEAMSAGSEVFQLLLSRCDDDKVKTECWFELAGVNNVVKFADCLELLLAAGVDVNVRRRHDGCTLYLCCLYHEEKLTILRNHGADPNVVDGSGNNILHVICCRSTCMRERLEHFIAEGLDPLSTNRDGYTLLHHAASKYNGELDVAEYVRWLISLGIPVNATDKRGRTALHLFQQRPKCGNTIHTKGRVHFVDAIGGRENIAFEIQDENGLTPLHLAAMRSEVEVATLLAAGANLSALTKDLQNVLHLSCRSRNPNTVGQILSQPAALMLDQKDCFGRTPVHYACSSGEPESVAYLLKHGFDVHAVDTDGLAPLHACAQFHQEQKIWYAQGQQNTWLRGPPTDPFRPQTDSYIPSYSVGYSKYRKQIPAPPQKLFPAITSILKMLLGANANVATVTKGGLTALGLALQTGCAEVVDFFAQNEALFDKSTKSLDDNERDAPHAAEIRKLMKAQMMLIRPKSALDLIHQDRFAFDDFFQSTQFLNMLHGTDAAQLINERFEINPSDDHHYRVVKKLMSSGNTSC